MASLALGQHAVGVRLDDGTAVTMKYVDSAGWNRAVGEISLPAFELFGGNSRSNKKRNAELIYFANAKQLQADGFDFYEYDLFATDNWFDGDGEGLPPFTTHHFPEHR